MTDERTVTTGETAALLCSQESAAALLAEIDRLRAAVQHEADCVEAAKAEIDRLTRERDEARAERDAMAKALRELLEAEGASFPNAILGRAAQDAWADRKANAREQARATLAQIEQEKANGSR